MAARNSLSKGNEPSCLFAVCIAVLAVSCLFVAIYFFTLM